VADLLYGRQPVMEVFRAGRRTVANCWMLDTARPDASLEEIKAAALKAGVPVHGTDRHALDTRTDGANHQGVVIETDGYPYVDLEDILAHKPADGVPPVVIAADHVQDPQNLGGLLRSAETAGVSGLIIPKDRSAEVTPSAVRASAGAAEHVRVARVVNLTRALEAAKERDFWVAGLESVPEAKRFDQADLNGPLVLVVGSEGSGLTRLVRETCDYLIRIPMWGRVESLNAQVAAAIALYEARRQYLVAAAK